MRWKILDKIISLGKTKDSSICMDGPENIEQNIPTTSSYDIKIKTVNIKTIKKVEDGR